MDFKQLDALAKELQSLRPLNTTELKRLRDEFMVENTYHSNAIEGNTLTLRETALVLQEGITIADKPLKDHLEAIGHKDAFSYVESLVDAQMCLSERVVREIHTLVLMNDRLNCGTYRAVPVTILGAVHTPPQPHLVPMQMKQLLDEYELMKKEMHIVEAISTFHLRFEGIHPFIDGNGRTGRLILNLELMRAGLLPINIKFADRMKYYDAFDCYYGNEHTADALTNLIATYEIEALRQRVAIIKGK